MQFIKARLLSYSFLSLLFAVLIFSAQSKASPNIHFTEYRILLTDTKSSQDYQIFNQGTGAAYCYTGLIDHNVTSSGELSVAKEDNRPETSAREFVRISPRRVLVPAMSSQKVKVVARNLRRQRDGEWVSYLSLKCKDHNPANQAGLYMKPNFIFNIPIVVRKGKLDAVAKFEHTKVEQHGNKYIAKFNINRQGQRSLFGDILVRDDFGILAFRKGFSHYLQSDSVPLNLPLQQKPKGKVVVEFKEVPQFGGNIYLKQIL